MTTCQYCGVPLEEESAEATGEPESVTLHRHWHWALARLVPCLACGAEAGKPCLDSDGRETSFLHDNRVMLTAWRY